MRVAPMSRYKKEPILGCHEKRRKKNPGTNWLTDLD